VPSASTSRRRTGSGRVQRRRSSTAATGRRARVTLVLIALAAAAAGAAVGSRDSAAPQVHPIVPPAIATKSVPPRLTITVDGVARARILVSSYLRARKVDESALTDALAARLPTLATVRRSRATITYRYDVEATAHRAEAIARSGGRVEAVRRPVSARIAAPVVAQAQRNTCESAALEILLATRGRRVSQERLQRAFPRSGPLDPQGQVRAQTWGDPDRGFVGRPDGGGTAGGFGIYPGPVRATALRFDVQLDDVSGASPEAVYRRLLSGRAVMAWVGLSDGPYGQWTSPQGRTVEVNFGEHTVVLYGVRADGSLLVSNPLEGTRELWSRAQFASMWALLGRRALSA
jgi:uncharacterized protein YvpB